MVILPLANGLNGYEDMIRFGLIEIACFLGEGGAGTTDSIQISYASLETLLSSICTNCEIKTLGVETLQDD